MRASASHGIKPDPLLGITLGDINGIGPEIVFAALNHPATRNRRVRIAVIGNSAVIRQGASDAGLPLPPEWMPSQPWPANTRVVQWDPAPSRRPPKIESGKVTAAAGKIAAEALEAAANAACRGLVKGIVTGPVCKQSLHLAGHRVPGQTEWLADLSGATKVGMLLVGGYLRVVLATRHLPLAKVPAAVTGKSVSEAIELLSAGLQWLGVANRRMGVCALNPHAGDGGILGVEDQEIIAPAVLALQSRGLTVEGPIPADVIFHLARKGRFGGIVAMYHDQGLAPLKMASFSSGVNITLGLPFVRTSPDHGTAFDIAGRKSADPRSMVAAIGMAVRLVNRPNPWIQPVHENPTARK